VSDNVTIALIVAASTLLQAYIASRNHAATVESVAKVSAKVDDTAKAIDGRMDQLVNASKAEGAQQQRAETRQDAQEARQDAKDALG
jgi:hypothetical protein